MRDVPLEVVVEGRAAGLTLWAVWEQLAVADGRPPLALIPSCRHALESNRA